MLNRCFGEMLIGLVCFHTFSSSLRQELGGVSSCRRLQFCITYEMDWEGQMHTQWCNCCGADTWGWSGLSSHRLSVTVAGSTDSSYMSWVICFLPLGLLVSVLDGHSLDLF